MKIYKFEPNDYSEHFTILASSSEEALNVLLSYMNTTKYYQRHKWVGATINSLPEKYSIKEYGKGEVIQAENS